MPSTYRSLTAMFALVALAGLLRGASPGQTCATIGGTEQSTTFFGGNERSESTAITPDGRYVLFYSFASNLVMADTNGQPDVFVRDTQSNTTILVSATPGGESANGQSYATAITPDGRYVLFYSSASNLVLGDSNGQVDVFVRDTQGRTTTLVSAATGGGSGNGGNQATAITPDGRYVLFYSSASNLVLSDTNGQPDVFVRDTQSNTTALISATPGGSSGNSVSQSKAITPDGRYVLFFSSASNLVLNDTNGTQDVFVRDTHGDTTVLVSVAAGGGSGNGQSAPTAITPDGGRVLFSSFASNLVSNDLNGTQDVFVRDTQGNSTILVSRTPGVGSGNGQSYATAITPEGRYVLFNSSASDLVVNDTNGYQDAFMRDTGDGTTTVVSVSTGGGSSNSPSDAAAITPDGRYVLFSSSASNLVLNDTNGWQDGFVRDTQAGTTILISASAGGGSVNPENYALALTPDARYVLLSSGVLDPPGGVGVGPANVYRWSSSSIELASVAYLGSAPPGPSSLNTRPAMSYDGRFVAFTVVGGVLIHDRLVQSVRYLPSVFVTGVAISSNAYMLIVSTSVGLASVYDLVTGDCLWSPPPGIVTFNPAPSGDGLWIAYRGPAGTVQARNLATDVTVDVSVPAGGGSAVNGDMPSVSRDGRYIAFESPDSLEPGDSNGKRDIYIRDRVSASTWRASIGWNGQEANGNCLQPWISGDGRFVAFVSSATNLIANDTNNTDDVFVRDRQTSSTILVSRNSTGVQAARWSGYPAMSEDGRVVTFMSLAYNLVTGDSNRLADIFAYDLATGATRRLSVSSSCSESDGYSYWPTPLIGGRWCAFSTFATNLVPGLEFGTSNVVIRDCAVDSDCGGSPGSVFCAGTAGACPCGIPGEPMHGCENSLATGGAFLLASGYASSTLDTIRLSATGMVPNGSALFFQGSNQVNGGLGTVFGDGLRCATGGVLRLAVVTSDSAGAASIGYEVPGTGSVAALGAIPVGGATRHYQVWYRNVAPFCAPEGFNLSNGYTLVWTY